MFTSIITSIIAFIIIISSHVGSNHLLRCLGLGFWSVVAIADSGVQERVPTVAALAGDVGCLRCQQWCGEPLAHQGQVASIKATTPRAAVARVRLELGISRS